MVNRISNSFEYMPKRDRRHRKHLTNIVKITCYTLYTQKINNVIYVLFDTNAYVETFGCH